MPDDLTLAQRIRTKYPGSYDDMDDAALETKVLAKYPQYGDLPRTKAPAASPLPASPGTQPPSAPGGTWNTHDYTPDIKAAVGKGMDYLSAFPQQHPQLLNAYHEVGNVAHDFLSPKGLRDMGQQFGNLMSTATQTINQLGGGKPTREAQPMPGPMQTAQNVGTQLKETGKQLVDVPDWQHGDYGKAIVRSAGNLLPFLGEFAHGAVPDIEKTLDAPSPKAPTARPLDTTEAPKAAAPKEPIEAARAEPEAGEPVQAATKPQVDITNPEAGMISNRPAPPKPIPHPNSPIGQLTHEIQQMKKVDPKGPLGEGAWEDIKDKVADTGNKLMDGITKVNVASKQLVDNYLHLPKWDGFKDAIGQWHKASENNSADAYRFAKDLKTNFPDRLTREAITNYVQANGDMNLLQQRAQHPALNGRLRRGYERAMNLSPEAITFAKNVRTYYDQQLVEAQNHGILHDGLGNYVNQSWKSSPYKDKLINSIRGDALKPNPSFSKQRFYDSYFHGESQGMVPKNKDIGYLVTNYQESMGDALASRAFIKKLLDTPAKDGRPIAEVSGSGRVVPDPRGTRPEAVVVNPTAHPKGTEGYNTVNHPALRGWTWATNVDGHDVFMKGDLLIHPDHLSHMQKMLEPSVIRTNRFGRGLLRATSEVKSLMFSLSLFHHVQEGYHAYTHWVNPTPLGGLKEIDYTPGGSIDKLLDHGLTLMDHSAEEQFRDGFGSRGVMQKVPIAGTGQRMLQDHLFHDYIPKLKADMASKALEHNMKTYADDLRTGKVNEDQILAKTAEEANAAFGGLNYKLLGRSKTMQDLSRLFLIAPDFLEARARFVGQALKPYGREQQIALARNVATLVVGGRIISKLFSNDKDYHWDKPLSAVIGNNEYSIRSVPGDVLNAWTDPRTFVYHRLSPLTVRPAMELLTGRDEFGRKKSVTEQAVDVAKTSVPVGGQGFLNKYGDTSGQKSALESVGIHQTKYRTAAEKMAHTLAMDKIPPGFESKGITHLATEIFEGTADNEEIADALKSGKLKLDDLDEVITLAQKSPFERDFHQLSLPEMTQVWAVAKDQEKAVLAETLTDRLERKADEDPAQYVEALQAISK